MKEQKNFILKLKLDWKLNKIKIFYGVLSLVEIALILVIALFNNRLLEMLIITSLFLIFRNLYEKQWHAKTLFECACYSVAIFGLISFIAPSKNISILLSCLLPFGITFISYHIKNYLEQCELLEKKLESLTLDEMKGRFKDYTEYEIKAVYSYINRGTKLADNIAMKYGYSTRQLQRLVKKMKDDLK